MKPIVFPILWVLVFAGMKIFISCKKESNSEECITGNKPPLVVAGPDQTIFLPANSVSLDGSGSYDPDNNIKEYAWIKISGPPTGNISNTNAVQTQVINLEEGAYKFELKITDKCGLTVRDTVVVLVTRSITEICTGSNIRIVTGPGSLIPFKALSEPAVYNLNVVADKILFSGGFLVGGPASNRVDIYNPSTDSWTTAFLTQGSSYWTIQGGNKILFRTNTGFDIYDAVTNSWFSLPVQDSMFYRGPDITVAGNKIFFAGGLITNDIASSRIDIYDITTATWSTASLSEGRTGINVITTGNKLIFAGGYKKWNPIDYPDDPSMRADIYDLSANTWTSMNMPFQAFGGYAATVANKVFFTFENNFNHVSIYDINTNTWSVASLSVPRLGTRPIAVGNKLLLVGDRKQVPSGRIDIYDATTNSWSTTEMASPGTLASFAASGNKVLMITAQTFGTYQWSVFNVSNNTVSAASFNYPLYSVPVEANNQVFLAGGFVKNGSSYQHMNCVWKFEF